VGCRVHWILNVLMGDIQSCVTSPNSMCLQIAEAEVSVRGQMQ